MTLKTQPSALMFQTLLSMMVDSKTSERYFHWTSPLPVECCQLSAFEVAAALTEWA